MSKEPNFTENINDFRINLLENEIKMSKPLAIVSGAVASLSALIVAGNLLVNNPVEALQTGGNVVAMAGYAYGYTKAISLTKKQIDNKKNITNENGISTVKENLEYLKLELAKLHNTKNMAITASTGFGVTALAHLAEIIMMPSPAAYISSSIGIILAGTVAVLDAWLAIQQNTRIKTKQNEVDTYQKLSDAEDEIKELASPEFLLEGQPNIPIEEDEQTLKLNK